MIKSFEFEMEKKLEKIQIGEKIIKTENGKGTE